MALITGGDNRNNAAVDSTFRLQTRSISRTDGVAAGIEGDAFFIVTPIINLTTATESLGWVYQNDEDRDLIIISTSISSSLSVGATDQVMEIRRVSGIGLTASGGAGFPMITPNKRFGSNDVLANTSEVGQEGASLSTPQETSPAFTPTGQSVVDPQFFVIPKGVSFGELATPPAGNTSIDITFVVECYLREIVE